MNVHFNTTTGEIVSYGYGADHNDGFEASPYDGCAVALIENQPIDPRAQRFDPITWKIVAKEVPEPGPDPILKLKRLVQFELEASDKYVLPDFPIGDAERAAWVTYRKGLRDASKGNTTAAAMLAAIPRRPDGSDPTTGLMI